MSITRKFKDGVWVELTNNTTAPSRSLNASVQHSAPAGVGTDLKKPGDIFALVIFKITGQNTANCGECGRRKRQMNKWGWLGCLRPKNRKQIIAWLCEEAAKRGHQIDGNQMLALFKAAIKELRSKSVPSAAVVVNS